MHRFSWDVHAWLQLAAVRPGCLSVSVFPQNDRGCMGPRSRCRPSGSRRRAFPRCFSRDLVDVVGVARRLVSALLPVGGKAAAAATAERGPARSLCLLVTAKAGSVGHIVERVASAAAATTSGCLCNGTSRHSGAILASLGENRLSDLLLGVVFELLEVCGVDADHGDVPYCVDKSEDANDDPGGAETERKRANKDEEEKAAPPAKHEAHVLQEADVAKLEANLEEEENEAEHNYIQRRKDGE